MSRKLIFALLLIAAAVVILIVNRGPAEVDLLVTKIKSTQSFIYLGFTALGVLIGILLR